MYYMEISMYPFRQELLISFNVTGYMEISMTLSVYIVYVIESAAYGVLCTSCLCQKPERASEGF